jgi:phage baseplate assembly protein W
MPIVQTTRINPLDLQKNTAIGVSLPFDGNFGPFNSTYSTQDQIKSNLINLLLTSKGERVFNPEFGSDLKKIVFEAASEDRDTRQAIQDIIVSSVNTFIPEVDITAVEVVPNVDGNAITITVNYKLKISGNSDEITVEFI